MKIVMVFTAERKDRTIGETGGCKCNCEHCATLTHHPLLLFSKLVKIKTNNIILKYIFLTSQQHLDWHSRYRRGRPDVREKFKSEKKGSKTRSEEKNNKREEQEKRNKGRKKEGDKE